MASRRTRARVHEAVLSLASLEGFTKLTMEGVASRAGVGKQTLYRSWTSTGAILFDALLARSQSPDGIVVVPDSGNLRADLIELVQETIAELCHPTTEPLLRSVTAAIQTDLILATQYRKLLLEPQMQAVAGRLHRGGVERAEELAEILVGPLLHRWLLRSGTLDNSWAEAHVERVLRASGTS
ncbi:TetR/AcrR family transcriptional regulator [Arthrobacter zhaoguopingii]|uniref:TetR/AcrR family transcriptional regulator n=1 Tax=Arthrobacter zhaoguopingii TaxID=2681491 RepID=UPI001357EE81|nr:TetR/AcrR family transcriptional regulator [Arthrobacter zhaoguopingii]